MKAILFDAPGDPDVLYLGEAPAPVCGPDDLRITVSATAINRADLIQRRGLYPPPPGASPILGLEAAGRISEVGASAQAAGFALGQRVMALLSGGGYAEQVVAPWAQVMRVPERLSDEAAAAVPEAFLTAYLNLFILGGLPFPEGRPSSGPGARPAPPPPAGRPYQVLIHGGASGVGTAALQLCREARIRAYCTAGSPERAARCRELGASFVWDYHDGDFSEALLRETQGQGVDVVLDCVGAPYLDSNLRVLCRDGRLVCIGLLGGARGEVDLARLLMNRLQLVGSTLRTLPPERKEDLVQRFIGAVLPLLASGRLEPVIDRVLPLPEAASGHRALDEHHVGKIVLRVKPA